ncbi:MAG: DUF3098 domain-containing protein [Nonlabens sp.]|nr:DUF3098 domain-containing protein [Nonlabens sp.]
MKNQKTTPDNKPKEENIKPRFEFIFKRKNYVFMLIGLGVIALGFALMAGGGSDNPEVFNEAIFSWRRIRLAPTLVLIGFGIEIYAILLDPEK